MDADDSSAEEDFQPGGSEQSARALAHLRDIFAEVVRPYVAATLAQEHEGYAYDERMEVLMVRDELLYGGGDDDDEEEPDFDESGNEIEADGDDHDDPAEKVTEEEITRQSSAVAIALTYQWMAALVENAWEQGDFALEAGEIPDNFDAEPLFRYTIDPKQDLAPIMAAFNERLFEKTNRVQLPMGLQIAKDGESGYLVVTSTLEPG